MATATSATSPGTKTSADSTERQAVDSLADYKVESNLESSSGLGTIKLLHETHSARVGWMAEFTVFGRGTRQVYKVMLCPIKSHSYGESLARLLAGKAASGRARYRVGNRQMLYVECLYSASGSGAPTRGCDASSDQSDKVLDGAY